MTYDPNFPHMTPDDPLNRKIPLDDTGSGWSVPIALGVMVFIVGALIMFSPSSTDRTTTASNNPQTTTRSTPAPAPRVMPNTGAPTAPTQ
jgi:hypothetical protein